MNINELKETLQAIISLRDEIEKLTKNTTVRHTYTLKDYVDLCHNKITWVDYGDRDKFYVPYHTASMRLSELRDIDDEKFNSAFKTHKTKLLSILNRYIKDLQHGFELHDLELRQAHQH